jgi:hypothetical protein
MFEKLKSETTTRSFLFGAIAAASIGNGDMAFAQERQETPESDISFTELTIEEVTSRPVNELLFDYADNFVDPSIGNHTWEQMFEKAFDENLTGATKIALVDEQGNAVVVNDFVRYSEGECSINFEDYLPDAGVTLFVSKTPEVCTFNVLHFTAKELLS